MLNLNKAEVVSELKTNKYLKIFPIETSNKKIMKLVLIVPATNVIGSPTIGTHENNNDHLPYLTNQLDAFAIFFLSKGNQFFFSNFLEKIPNNQFTQEPKMLPKLANNNKSILLWIPSDNKLANPTSEEKGSIVAAKKETKKILK